MSFEKFDITVLYVEDQETLRDEISSQLTKFFTNVIVAIDGEDGLQKFKQNHNNPHSLDLVITDIEMPKMNGFELVQQARKLNGDIHAIITSGLNFGRYLENINSIAILNTYIQKPIDMKILFERIKEAMQSINSRRKYKQQYNLTQQYQNALDSSAIVSKTDLKGVITYVNDTFCQISGYTKEELIGQPHSIVRDPDVPKELYKQLWNTIKAKMIFRHPSLPNRAKNGSRYYVDTTIIPILDENRQIFEYISIRFDTTSLYNSLNEEKKAKETQALFLANMSHEIRTPLNGILGFTKLLEEAKLETKEKEYVSIVNSSASTLLTIINDILNISKLQNGQMDLEYIWFNPYIEFINLKKLFEANANEKNINFICNVCKKAKLDETENILLKGDITKLKQVLSNLINNAIKFTPLNGEIIFDIELIEQIKNKAKFKFSVKDNGIGIPEDKQDQIFESFKQADVSTTREYGGTGLGLTISKHIVELFDSKLELISQENQGSEFFFFIELEYKKGEDNIKENTNTKETNYNEQKYKGTVLVAEDVEINQKLIEIVLQKKGLDVVFASNGLEAVEIFHKDHDKFCLVLLDINMPVMDGLEAFTKIDMMKKYKKSKDIPIVSLTANAIKGDKERFLEHGFNHYLSKPLNNDELSKILHKYLQPVKNEETEDQNSLQKIDNLQNYNIVEVNAKKLDLPEDFYLELLSSYLKTINSEIEILLKYLINNNQDQFSNQAHKLKGVSVNLNLLNIFELFKNMEDRSKSKDELLNYIEKTKNEIEVIRSNIKKSS
jgi:PAS domain S-box-containing protein